MAFGDAELAETPVLASPPLPSSPRCTSPSPPALRKSREPASSAKRKRSERAEVESEQVQKKAHIRDAIKNLEGALLAAAPSAGKVLELLEGQSSVTLANAIARLAASANAGRRCDKENGGRCCDSLCECLRSQRAEKLWPSIKERLENQMRFSSSYEDDQSQGRLKLEVRMVPEEAVRQWLNEYLTLKQLVADTKAHLKFRAVVDLGLGHVSNGLEQAELTFALCKVSHKLVITGKHYCTAASA